VQYCDNHITRLASHFIRGESSGGYLVNSAHESASVSVGPTDEEGMQVRLLSLDSTWDLFTRLMELLKDETKEAETRYDTVTVLRAVRISLLKPESCCVTSESGCQWEFVRDLLHADSKHFLPFDALSTVSPQDYALHFGTSYQRAVTELGAHLLLMYFDSIGRSIRTENSAASALDKRETSTKRWYASYCSDSGKILLTQQMLIPPCQPRFKPSCNSYWTTRSLAARSRFASCLISSGFSFPSAPGQESHLHRNSC